jgi:UDP-glucose 4-epimerase
MAKSLLVTGGAGFIGSNLVNYINRVSPETVITVIDDLSTGLIGNLAGSNHVFHHGSILDYAALRESAEDADSIIHLAAIGSVPRSVAEPRPSHDTNATGTLNVLEVARELKIPHVIVASSSSVYGSNPAIPKEELDWTRPMSPYAVTKLATESYAIAYGFSYSLSTLALRFFNVYGPHQRADHAYAAVIPRFLNAIINGEPVLVHGDGTQSRDFTYVETVCAGLYQAFKDQLSSTTPINLAFGGNTSLLNLIKVIEKQIGHKIESRFSEARVGDVKLSQANAERMIQIFPNLKPTSLEEGIKLTLEWMRTAK